MIELAGPRLRRRHRLPGQLRRWIQRFQRLGPRRLVLAEWLVQQPLVSADFAVEVVVPFPADRVGFRASLRDPDLRPLTGHLARYPPAFAGSGDWYWDRSPVRRHSLPFQRSG